ARLHDLDSIQCERTRDGTQQLAVAAAVVDVGGLHFRRQRGVATKLEAATGEQGGEHQCEQFQSHVRLPLSRIMERHLVAKLFRPCINSENPPAAARRPPFEKGGESARSPMKKRRFSPSLFQREGREG